MLRVKNLNKIYRYEMPGLASVFRDAIGNGFGTISGHKREIESNEFYALRDINLSVGVSESVGIIGANGSGKSTFLKIISRVTPPSSGEIFLYGRVGALLEIGGGFNHELTGRENIYLLGALLGMSLAEVGDKFEEIVAFAEIDSFRETQLKRYSPGMQVRLAFSIAAHYKPDLLILDEILAVADAEFQARCLEKLDELKRQGVTLLFVSHDLKKMERVCDRTIWLEKGNLKMDGETSKVQMEYLNKLSLDTPHEIGTT